MEKELIVYDPGSINGLDRLELLPKRLSFVDGNCCEEVFMAMSTCLVGSIIPGCIFKPLPDLLSDVNTQIYHDIFIPLADQIQEGLLTTQVISFSDYLLWRIDVSIIQLIIDLGPKILSTEEHRKLPILEYFNLDSSTSEQIVRRITDAIGMPTDIIDFYEECTRAFIHNYKLFQTNQLDCPIRIRDDPDYHKKSLRASEYYEKSSKRKKKTLSYHQIIPLICEQD